VKKVGFQVYEEEPDWAARWTVVQEVCNRTPVLLPEPVLDDEVRKDKYKSKNKLRMMHFHPFTKFLTSNLWPDPDHFLPGPLRNRCSDLTGKSI
jgi:hypothetical protein